jgi:uncharacterized membrane protein YdjX (TVP38/TMEM64 family)
VTPEPDESPEARPRSLLARFGPLVALIAVAVAAYAAGLPARLAPAALAREQAQLHAAATGSPAIALVAFVAGYAVVVASGIPIALMLSLLGGLIFGGWVGALAVLLGATGAALITYAAARSAFAASLAARAGRDPRLGRLMAGLDRNAFLVVLSTRLAPFVPFGLVNVAAGLAAVPVRQYAAATLLGGAPAALIYANLGAGLGGSLGSDRAFAAALHSPRVLASLGALALMSAVPLAAPAVLRRVRRPSPP